MVAEIVGLVIGCGWVMLGAFWLLAIIYYGFFESLGALSERRHRNMEWVMLHCLYAFLAWAVLSVVASLVMAAMQ